ncbi:KpsF/GutQ family sugar-phosphate isomerase [Apibacter adventoris]|uniref:D-arabinose 5-phosphate isomerase n=1 Tax=Apibacter adventoris TaxID=1679466 RepID=A0A2S8AEM4_9FLAO|nr:KpsF/GutQ family sugar-phosphate isomerase [Apibacter adventoris]PQL93503.1 D-arabinose 5-phosphate isomerase [Apibacter adventoris]PQL94649.1 D-arabinose 5-phosphate isomerase [Apibacter adventoris]
MENEKILNAGKNTILFEIAELQSLNNRLGEDFIKAVHYILECKGKLILCGIGKSAHIANKLVATFNSTGTRSQFLHAAEAKHGDLGIVTKDDIIVCISNSGTSSEIQEIVPFLREYCNILIAMTANKNCLLAEVADLVLDTHIDKEADPNNLAPTTSTTVQLALGDALAVALLEARNFKSSDFAKFHPGGALGKKLLCKVEQLIKPDKKPAVQLSSHLKEIINSLTYSSYGITVVIENNHVMGVITDGDLRRIMAKDIDYNKIMAKDIMSLSPKTIQKNELANKALEILKKNQIGQLVVLDGDKYVGIIDLHILLENGFK